MAKAITLTSTVSAPYTHRERRSVVKQIALLRLARKLFGKKILATSASNSHEVYLGL